MSNGANLVIDAHAYSQMAVRLSDTEKRLIEARIAIAYSRSQAHSLGVVALDLTVQRATDNAGVSSNGNLVIGIVRMGVLKTVMLRRDSQEVSKTSLGTAALKWVGVAKRATGNRAYRGRRHY